MSEVTVREQAKPFKLLTPGNYPARTGSTFQVIGSPSDLLEVLYYVSASGVVAVDLETKGNDYSLYGPEHHIVGIGLAWDTGSVYFNWADLSDDNIFTLLYCLSGHRGLIAHNVFFDGGFLKMAQDEYVHKTGQAPIQWYRCTYGLYMQLANEGFLAQKWGLKEAEIDLLGWEHANDVDLNQWLIDSGYKNKNGNPLKAEMWRAPPEILGKYCCLDVEATYLLYTKILAPVLKRFPELDRYHSNEWLHLVDLLIDQKIIGIKVDRQKLQAHHDDLYARIESARQAFLSHPDVQEPVAQFEMALLSKYIAKEPVRLLKRKITQEPAKFRKDGEVSKSWITWDAKSNQEPAISKNWLRWQERYQSILKGEDPDYQFNIRSGAHLRWLIYDHLQFPVSKTTGGGLPAVDNRSLRAHGEVGNLLIDYADLVKEQSYVRAYLDTLESTGRNTIHPSFKCPGTVTGRLSSKDPNIQQMPKTKAVMSCFVANEGWVWVDLDFTALEPCITTELSRCPKMMSIFGPDAKPNDIYLFVGAHIDGLCESILATGYDPYNPTKEGVAAAKKQCKRERSICKNVHLACAYGAGPAKIHSTLQMEGIDIDLDTVRDIHRMYWDLFEVVKEYSNSTIRQWRDNGGYVMNAIGRPMCVDDEIIRDCMNRVVQSSGHDILVKYVQIVANQLNAEKIPWVPVIVDWHDSCCIEVPEDYKDAAVRVMNDCVTQLNRLFEHDTVVPLRGTAECGYNLADVKGPEA